MANRSGILVNLFQTGRIPEDVVLQEVLVIVQERNAALDAIENVDKDNRGASLLISFLSSENINFNQVIQPILVKCIQEIKNKRVYRRVLELSVCYPYLDLSLLLAEVDKAGCVRLQARLLTESAAQNPTYFAEALEIARARSDGDTLIKLAEINPTYFDEALDASSCLFDDWDVGSHYMRRLAKIKGADLSRLWSITSKIRDQREYFYALAQIARSDRSRIPQILDLIDSADRPSIADTLLIEILKIDNSYESRIIAILEKFEGPDRCSSIFVDLARINFDKYYAKALKNIDLVEDFRSHLSHLLNLLDLGVQAEADRSETKEEKIKALAAKLLEIARSHQDKSVQASILCSLAALDTAYIAEAWELSVSLLQSEDDENQVSFSLDKLVKLDHSYWPQALEIARSFPKSSCSYAEALASLAAIDSACLTEAIEAFTTVDENLHWVDNIFQQLFNTYSPQKIQTSLDAHQYQLLLDWAKSRRHSVTQAHTLIDLAEFDSNYFPEALAKVQSLPLENRTWALARLANIAPNYYGEAWDAVTQLAIAAKTESSDSSTYRQAYTGVLVGLAPDIPEEMFPELEEAIAIIPASAERARILVHYIPRIAPEQFSHERLASYLRDLASGQRDFLMHNLANLAPAIVHLAGKETLQEVVDTMEDVCRQWP